MTDGVHDPVTDGALCATVSDARPFLVLGWPIDVSKAVVLLAARRYQLSYDVKASGSLPIAINAKVGHAVMPFTEDFAHRHEVTINNTYSTFAYASILTMGDNQAGVALELSANGGSGSSTVCVDNISLSELGPPP